MKKRLWVIFFIGLFVVMLLFIYITCTINGENKELLLDDFQSENEYKYNGFEWKITEKEAKKIIPIKKLQEDLWGSKARYILDGKSTIAKLGFHNNELINITFSFDCQDDCGEWFDRQLTKLIKIYGKESDKIISSTEAFISQIYRWDTEYTSLQFVLIEGESIECMATLGVMVK